MGLMKDRFKEFAGRLESAEVAGLRGSLIFVVLSSVAIAICLVLFSMHLYNQSGAAQLDLSRPSYENVRSQGMTERFDGFDTSQDLNQKSLEGFEEMYKEKRDDLRGYADAFGPSDISDEALGIEVE